MTASVLMRYFLNKNNVYEHARNICRPGLEWLNPLSTAKILLTLHSHWPMLRQVLHVLPSLYHVTNQTNFSAKLRNAGKYSFRVMRSVVWPFAYEAQSRNYKKETGGPCLHSYWVCLLVDWPMNTDNHGLNGNYVTETLLSGNMDTLSSRKRPVSSSIVLMGDCEYDVYAVKESVMTVLKHCT